MWRRSAKSWKNVNYSAEKCLCKNKRLRQRSTFAAKKALEGAALAWLCKVRGPANALGARALAWLLLFENQWLGCKNSQHQIGSNLMTPATQKNSRPDSF
jgi:hypothetical protein